MKKFHLYFSRITISKGQIHTHCVDAWIPDSLCNIHEPHLYWSCASKHNRKCWYLYILGTATCSKAQLLEGIDKGVGVPCIHVTTVILMIGSKQITYAWQPTTEYCSTLTSLRPSSGRWSWASQMRGAGYEWGTRETRNCK